MDAQPLSRIRPRFDASELHHRPQDRRPFGCLQLTPIVTKTAHSQRGQNTPPSAQAYATKLCRQPSIRGPKSRPISGRPPSSFRHYRDTAVSTNNTHKTARKRLFSLKLALKTGISPSVVASLLSHDQPRPAIGKAAQILPGHAWLDFSDQGQKANAGNRFSPLFWPKACPNRLFFSKSTSHEPIRLLPRHGGSPVPINYCLMAPFSFERQSTKTN